MYYAYGEGVSFSISNTQLIQPQEITPKGQFWVEISEDEYRLLKDRSGSEQKLKNFWVDGSGLHSEYKSTKDLFSIIVGDFSDQLKSKCNSVLAIAYGEQNNLKKEIVFAMAIGDEIDGLKSLYTAESARIELANSLISNIEEILTSIEKETSNVVKRIDKEIKSQHKISMNSEAEMDPYRDVVKTLIPELQAKRKIDIIRDYVFNKFSTVLSDISKFTPIK
jgi:co-chaperonin GroES (HSP10)